MAEENGNSHRTSATSVCLQAAMTTLPLGNLCSFTKKKIIALIVLGLDDIVSSKKMEEISIEFFNGFKRKTVGRGAIKPRTSVIVTSNMTFSESPRYCSTIIMQNMTQY